MCSRSFISNQKRERQLAVTAHLYFWKKKKRRWCLGSMVRDSFFLLEGRLLGLYIVFVEIILYWRRRKKSRAVVIHNSCCAIRE